MAIPYEQIVPKNEVARLMRNHGRLLGSVFHLVQSTGDGTILRVLPTACEGVLPAGKRGVVWANIWWQHETHSWMCVLYNTVDEDELRMSLGLGKNSWHKTLKSALRKARKTVGANAPKAEAGWESRIRVPQLDSVYPSKSDYRFATDYWADVGKELEEENLAYGDEELGGYDYFGFDV